MPEAPRFPVEIVAALRDGKSLRLRAGSAHRFIGLWVVVVEDRVFIRSWSVKPQGWYRILVADPRGFIQVADRTIPVLAVGTRSDRIKRAVDRAYLAKYSTPGALRYAKDLGSAKSRATTTELRPAARRGAGSNRAVNATVRPVTGRAGVSTSRGSHGRGRRAPVPFGESSLTFDRRFQGVEP